MSGLRSTGSEIEHREPASSTRCSALQPQPRIDPRDASPLSTSRWLFGPLFGGFFAALVLLGISHAAAFAVWALASAATVGIGVWHTRPSGRPVLPSAVMISRRRGER